VSKYAQIPSHIESNSILSSIGGKFNWMSWVPSQLKWLVIHPPNEGGKIKTTKIRLKIWNKNGCKILLIVNFVVKGWKMSYSCDLLVYILPASWKLSVHTTLYPVGKQNVKKSAFDKFNRLTNWYHLFHVSFLICIAYGKLWMELNGVGARCASLRNRSPRYTSPDTEVPKH